MPSVLRDFEYDIFISYRHNDNLDGWVTEFVDKLGKEIRSTIKENVSIYFDSNPNDGLLEMHAVSESLQNKLKCLIFIPILSQTYCDQKSYAWQEFLEFCRLSAADRLGRNVKLANGNVTSRILPIKIHEIDAEDKALVESHLGGPLRAVTFIFKSPGVNRPLRFDEDHHSGNINKVYYRDQVNKLANAVKEIIISLRTDRVENPEDLTYKTPGTPAVKPFLKKRKLSLVLVPLFLVLLAAIGFWWTSDKATAVGTSGAKPSIIILPFANLSNDAEQEYFSEGIADEIRTSLSSIDRLKVISRNSSMYFKGKDIPLAEIASRTKVDHILTGSLQKIGDQIKISVELSNAATDEVEWSLSTDLRPIQDVFNLQREIGIAVAKQLRVNLSQEEVNRSFKQYTNDPKVYERFLKLWQEMSAGGPENIRRVQEELTELIDQQPEYVPAIKALAMSYSIRGLLDLSDDSVRSKALPLYARADELDKENQVIPSALGFYKMWYEWDFKGAEKIGRHGLELSDFASIQLLAEAYTKLGNLEESLRMANLIGEINPISHGTYFAARYNLLAGKLDQAEKEIKKYHADDPGFLEPYRDLGLLYLIQERNQEAMDILVEATRKFNYKGPYLRGYLAIAYHRVGKQKEFEMIIDDLKSQYNTHAPGSPAFYVGLVNCNIDRVDEGMQWLENSFRNRDVEMTWLKMDPLFEPVKKDPRYLDLLKRVGF